MSFNVTEETLEIDADNMKPTSIRFDADQKKYLKALMIAFRKKTGERATLGWLIKKLIETAVPSFLEEYGITPGEISEIEKTIKVVKKEG